MAMSRRRSVPGCTSSICSCSSPSETCSACPSFPRTTPSRFCRTRSRISRAGSSAYSGSGTSPTKSSEGIHGPCLLFEKKGDKGIVIFAGKGGLGKTTCSAGLSHYMASKRKRNVLCFSTDPQASLSDIFDRDIFGKGLIRVVPNLDVVEIDADRRVADYQAEVKQKILTMYGLTELPTEIEEYIDSTSAEPAMYESATYDAMADLVSTSGHDLYVFDMPPFGHGVRMIAMA